MQKLIESCRVSPAWLPLGPWVFIHGFSYSSAGRRLVGFPGQEHAQPSLHNPRHTVGMCTLPARRGYWAFSRVLRTQGLLVPRTCCSKPRAKTGITGFFPISKPANCKPCKQMPTRTFRLSLKVRTVLRTGRKIWTYLLRDRSFFCEVGGWGGWWDFGMTHWETYYLAVSSTTGRWV